MKVNSPLNAFPWYDDFYDMDKFQSDCPECDYKLITDKTRLLPFQFRRPASGYPIARFFLRDACRYYWKPVSEFTVTHFINDTGDYSGTAVTIQGGTLKIGNTVAPSDMVLAFNPAFYTAGKKYKIKMVINEFKVTGGYVELHDFTDSNLFSMTTAGTYVVDVAPNLNPFISVNIPNPGDYVKFSEITVYEEEEYDAATDINISMIPNLVNVGSVDYVTSCGDPLPFQIPCGKYYGVIVMGDGSVFFSEMLFVYDFLPGMSKYVLLEWSNTCDIGDVLYNEPVCKQFFNRLYIDGPLTKPEYPFTQNSEQDGNGVTHPTFQKWEKNVSLVAPYAPEYIIDALTGMQLHDTISYTPAIRRTSDQEYGQLNVSSPVAVESVKTDITYVSEDCRANANLTMTTQRITDSTCCNNMEQATCVQCGFYINAVNVYDSAVGVALILGDGVGDATLYLYNTATSTWVPRDVLNDVVCINGDGGPDDETRKWYHFPDGWYLTPSIDSIFNTGHSYIVIGHAFPGSYLTFKALVFDIDFGASYDLDGIYTAAQFAAGIEIPYTAIPVEIPSCGFVGITATDYTLACEYGDSNEAVVTYDAGCGGYDPDAEAWFEALDVQPSTPYKSAVNNLITTLKTQGNWALLDRLWIHATEQQQHAQIDLKSLSSLTEHGSIEWDANVGYVTDGSTYVDSGYDTSAGTNYVQNSASAFIYALTSYASGSGSIFGSWNGTDSGPLLQLNRPGMVINAFMNQNTGSNAAPGIADTLGLFSTVRTNAAMIEVWKRGTMIGSAAITSVTIPSLTVYMGGTNHNNVLDFSSIGAFAVTGFGSGTIDQAALNTAIEALATAIGFNV